MKTILLVLTFILSSCAFKPVDDITKNQKPDIIQFQQDYASAHKLLSDKIEKCYRQKKGSYHLMGVGKAEEKTISKIDKNHKKAIIYHQYKTEFEREIMFYVQIQSRGPASSELKIYGKGKGLRTREELHKNIQDWLKGKKAYCVGRGTF